MANPEVDWLDTLTLGSLVRDCTLESKEVEEFMSNNGLKFNIFAEGLGTLSDDDILSQAEKVSFKGFDLNLIKKSFLKTALKVHPSLKSPQDSLRKEAYKRMMNDVNMMICFLVTRSNNTSKVTDLGESREEISKIFSSWEIRSNMQISNRQEGLTLARVCYLYPEIFFKTQILTHNCFRFGRVDHLDPIFHNSLAPAFIPKNSWGLSQMKLWLQWAALFNNQINSNKSQSQRNVSLRTTYMICRNQYQQGVSSSRRLEVLIETYASLLTTTAFTNLKATVGLARPEVRSEVRQDILEDEKLGQKIGKKVVDVYSVWDPTYANVTSPQMSPMQGWNFLLNLFNGRRQAAPPSPGPPLPPPVAQPSPRGDGNKGNGNGN